MTRKWTDEFGRLLLYNHQKNEVVPADDENKLCPFTLGYCSSIENMPGACFKDACELWDREMNRCSLSGRIRN